MLHYINGDKVNNKEYKNLVSKYSPKEPKLKNGIVSFFVGGLIGLIAQFLTDMFICLEFTKEDASLIVGLSIIFLASLFTVLGFFDTWVTKLKCGLIVPTTGFAHSVTSSALDYKKDGLITGLGSNFFKLAGSVILYGIISSFIFVVVGVLLNV